VNNTGTRVLQTSTLVNTLFLPSLFVTVATTGTWNANVATALAVLAGAVIALAVQGGSDYLAWRKRVRAKQSSAAKKSERNTDAVTAPASPLIRGVAAANLLFIPALIASDSMVHIPGILIGVPCAYLAGFLMIALAKSDVKRRFPGVSPT
jgi:hypothetical protein